MSKWPNLLDSINPDWIHVLKTKKSLWEQKYYLTQLAVFGSRARGDGNSSSDLDLLVDFRKPYNFDLLQFISLAQELEDELGVKVDLIIAEDLKPNIRDRVLSEARYL